jgi:hypothetical protein
MRLPLGPGDRRSGIEHRDGAGLVTVAFFAARLLAARSRSTSAVFFRGIG